MQIRSAIERHEPPKLAFSDFQKFRTLVELELMFRKYNFLQFCQVVKTDA
jgi:hypothetical protein